MDVCDQQPEDRRRGGQAGILHESNPFERSDRRRIMLLHHLGFAGKLWEEEGDHVVKAKVKDPYGAESDWTILNVTVTKSKSNIDFNPWIFRLIQNFPILKFMM